MLGYLNNLQPKGMIDYGGTKSQPITKTMVWQAYKAVKANKGSHGVDNMSWEYLDSNLKYELYKLWNRLTSGSYFPQAVRQVSIPKKDGGVRNLGIPTLIDRIAQQVAKVYLEKRVEPIFSSSSYGYRPKKSAHDAVSQACKNSCKYDFIIDLDIKGFFDNINHILLLKAVKHYCQEKWILLYVERWLKSGVVEVDVNFKSTYTGTPQGGVISPLLANIYLHVVLDGWMWKHHPDIPFERYADDVVVHCRSEKQAQEILKAIKKRMQECLLSLHPVKTKIVNIGGQATKKYERSYDFLGFTIKPDLIKVKTELKVIPRVFVSRKSKKSIYDTFKDMQIHKQRKPIEMIAMKLNIKIRGLINYYHKFGNSSMQIVWRGLNMRLFKWVRWEKKLSKLEAIKWLKRKYAENPVLFNHWLLERP